jgi:hypothetical protein
MFFGAAFSAHDVLLVTELCEASLEEVCFEEVGRTLFPVVKVGTPLILLLLQKKFEDVS